MKYIISENQQVLIDALKKRKAVKESGSQEFISQAYAPTNNESVQPKTSKGK